MFEFEPRGCTRRKLIELLAVGGVGLTFAGKLLASEPHVTKPSYNTLTDEEEIALGRDFDAKMVSEVQIIHHPLIDKYLNGIVSDLARASQRPSLPYNVKLVNTFDVNAASVPGGFLYVNRGLIQTIDTEGELAATLGHEVGHVVARHVTNRILLTFRARQVYEQVKANLLKNNQAVEQIIDQFGGAVAMLALMHFSREDEFEADMLGFYEMLRAHYDPGKFLELFAKFEKLEKQGGSQPNPYLADHPPTPERVERIRNELTQVRVPRGAKENTLSFRAFKAAMALLPSPPPPKKH
jgi:predicted Zn-dependent protease